MFSITSKNVKKFIHITKRLVIKRLDKIFFYGSDNFVVKPPMIMVQMMHFLQLKLIFKAMFLKENTFKPS